MWVRPTWSSLGFAYNQLDTDEYLGTESFDDYREALIDRYIEKALALNPNDTTAHHLKANRLRENDEWLEAEAEYMLAIESDSQSAAIYEDYAEFLFDVGRLEEALAVGRRSYELDPLTPLYITAYAAALLDTGDYAAAERFLSLALQQDDEYPVPQIHLLAAKLMQERYDEVLLQVSDPSWRWSGLGEFLTTLIDYARGKATSIPEVSADPETLREYIRAYYVAVVLMNQGDVDTLIKLGGQGLDYWKDRFFSRLWDRDEFREYVLQTGLVDYWRKSGKWGDMCRPRGEDDFECGVFE